MFALFWHHYPLGSPSWSLAIVRYFKSSVVEVAGLCRVGKGTILNFIETSSLDFEETLLDIRQLCQNLHRFAPGNEGQIAFARCVFTTIFLAWWAIGRGVKFLVLVLLWIVLIALSLLLSSGSNLLFFVWLVLYRCPVYDIIYPQLHTWRLKHCDRIYAELPQSSSTNGLRIRLVKLKPGSRQDVIECELVDEDLGESPFESLSYVWGTSLRMHKIRVNQQAFFVTANLYAALCHLRHLTDERTLWIDAIAINQADTKEKSSQVLHMCDIYRKATTVIIWLGHGTQKSSAAFKTARRMTGHECTTEDCLSRPVPEEEWNSVEQEWRRILTNDWWTRSWVIQEVVAGKKVVVQVGLHQLPWEILLAALKAPAFVQLTASLGFHTKMFCEMVRTLREGGAAPLKEPFTLFDLVYLFRDQSATLRSDKIYALQGLLPSDTPIKLIPDYSKSADAVYCEFTIACIEKLQDLLVVSLATGTTVHSVSWCRDWGSSVTSVSSLYLSNASGEFGRNFSAAGNHPIHYRVDLSQSILTLRGYIVDRIGKGSGNIRAGSPYANFKANQVLSGWEKAAGGPWRGNSTADSTANKSFNRVVSAGHMSEEQNWRRILEIGDSRQPSSAKDEMDINNLNTTCYNRQFVVTNGGRFGLASFNAQVGDLVVVLLGSSVPFILRPAKEPLKSKASPSSVRKDIETQQFFTFIGEAFVNGIMYYDGDITEDIASGQVILRDFNLI